MSADRKYVEEILLPELIDRFYQWEEEYQQERDLGLRGEFVGLYRKARKLKTALWDRPEPPTDWRESLRTIMFEVCAHALLMICDWDNRSASPIRQARPKPASPRHDCETAHPESVECWMSDKGRQPNPVDIASLRALSRPL